MSDPPTDPSLSLRRLVWLYFWLLLSEGALRKWLLPGLSGPLLLVRDPVAIAIYAMAIKENLFPRSGLISCTCLLAALSLAASSAGLGNWVVTVYGLRADFLHLPLVVLLPRILKPEDVRRMGLALLAVAPVIAAMAVEQFKSGPASRWNVGAGGEIGGQLYAAQGKVRASGTFSFATGLATYLGLCAAFLLHDLISRRVYPRWLVFAALLSLVLTLAVSGSRSAVIAVAVVCCMVLYVAVRRQKQFGAALRPVLLTLIAAGLLSRFAPVFDEGISVHRDRFASGGGIKEGIAVRTGREYAAAWDRLFTSPLLGVGLGVGTNVGASLLRGRREFTLGEGEWERVIMESGPVLGPAYIGLRLATFLTVLGAALAAYRTGRTLPLLLVGVSGLDMVTGQFGQPTALGFAVFTSGLALAACAAEEAIEREEPTEEVSGVPRIRGRSAYAERLHGGEGMRGTLRRGARADTRGACATRRGLRAQ